MASILNSKAKAYLCDSSANEELKLQIQSEADIFIKKLSKKQRDTEVNLEKCLQNEKEFKLAHTFNPTTELSAGTLNYDDFKQLSAQLDGEKKYPTEETDSKQTNKAVSRHIKELALAVKPNSLETKLLQFAISCNAVGETWKDTRPSDHPINQLDKIENDLFSHLSYAGDPQKTAKTILRKRKQLLEAISDPIGPKKVAEPVREKSLWDVTETAPICKNPAAKVYSCRSQPQKLYTIRDGTIVELQNENESQNHPTESKPKIISQSFICIETKNNSDFNIVSRLSEEEIRKIPKFQNYQKGNPSSVLYLKNLSSSIMENDLVSLFSKYQQPDKPRIIYKLLQKGKMRGQAFITFPTVEISTKALEEVNGTILYDKPIIIHYGKANAEIST